MKLLIPVDGSALSLEAVRHVLKLSQAGLDVELLLANVQESASLYEMVVAHDPAVLDFPLAVLRDRALPWMLDHADGSYPDWKTYRDRPFS